MKAHMRVEGFGATNPGLVRENNEDFILVDNDLGLYVVCDGMGGHAAGEVASSLAAHAIRSKIEARSDELRSLDISGRFTIQLVRDVIRHACAAVFRHAVESSAYRGMGTTVTLVLIQGTKAIIGHVGDSRLYLSRRGDLTQLTRDHTLGQDLLDMNALSPSDLENHSHAGVLTRAVGVYEDVEVDTFQLDLVLGDRLLLCSDGLYDALPNQNAFSHLLDSKESVDAIPKRLIEVANEQGGGPDNISTIVISVEADAHRLEAEQTRREQVFLSFDVVKSLFLFRELDYDELFDVAGLAVIQVIPPNTVVVTEGETDDGMYVIVAGNCELKKAGTPIAELESGSHFGEMTLLAGGPRSATVTSRTECTLIKISLTEFEDILQRRPATGVKLLLALGKELTHRLQRANERYS